MRGLWMIVLAGCAEGGAGTAAVSRPERPERPAEPPPGPAIVGGTDTSLDVYPATGVVTATMKLRCTGTLIAPDVVLTAAHCLTPPGFGYLGFTLDPDLSDGADDVVKALVTHKHPDYTDTAEITDLGARNDVGVMILERPIAVEAGRYEWVELATDPSVDQPLGLCGYGREVWATVMAGVKRTADVTVARVEELELATSDMGPQPCSGDSGAPLFDNTTAPHTLIGIVSRAVGDTIMCDSGAIVTRTAPYASWIAEAAQDRDVGCAGGVILPAWVRPWRRRRRRRPR